MQRAPLTRAIGLLSAAVLVMLAVSACSGHSDLEEKKSALETALVATSPDVISAEVYLSSDVFSTALSVSITVTTDHTEVTATELKTYLRLILDNPLVGPKRLEGSSIQVSVKTEDQTDLDLRTATAELDLSHTRYYEGQRGVRYDYGPLVEELGAAS